MQAQTNSDDASADGFLGNRLTIRQPRHGHRSGHDAVLLAASVGSEKAQTVCDLGAGAGVVGLCILARLPETQLVGVEIDPDLCQLAQENAAANGFAERAKFVAGDIAGPFSALGLEPNSFDHVVANPPFYQSDRVPPVQDAARARAHQTDAAGLENWVRCACALAAANGLVTFIHRAEALDDLLAAMRGRLGALQVQPVAPHVGEAAHRVLVQGRRDARAPLVLLPPIVLQNEAGDPSEQAEAVLRHGAALAFAGTGG